MVIHNDLERRMREYEAVPKIKLMKRTPVAVRLDGKAFHTFTRGFQKPFDDILIKSMQQTMEYLCRNIQGCVFGYTQSDEITLILIDYQTFETDAWFDYEVQKICSISASITTMAFNKFFRKNVLSYNGTLEYMTTLNNAEQRGAMFDARCFNISKDEVCNLVYWRQLDAIRNSIQMVGQANYSQKQLHKKTCKMIKEMLKEEKGIDWDKLPTHYQRGTACIYVDKAWIIDENMPILKGDDRIYLEKFIFLP